MTCSYARVALVGQIRIPHFALRPYIRTFVLSYAFRSNSALSQGTSTFEVRRSIFEIRLRSDPVPSYIRTLVRFCI